jgi:ATP-dependent zinc metalloprotease ftsH
MMKKIGNIIRIALVIVVIALIFMNLKNGFETNINYSEMVSAIKQEKVKKIKIASDKTYVRYIYNDKNARTNIPNDQVFLTEISDKIKDGFVIEQEELTFVDKVVQNTVVILPTAIVIILVISWINMASIRARQEMPDKDIAIGRSKARLIEEDENTVRFDNVAGIEEEKGELKEIVDFLKNPQKYIEMGARIPKGVLLVGRPGTR